MLQTQTRKERDSAYTLFYMGVRNAGALWDFTFNGYLGEKRLSYSLV
jgi:dipeptide/tripeptide permease